MRKFNTHGGYFSPQGYLRINEGGSHDENPNGGVQLGTDGQGIPNMLEENEPVYNDFVYSDNIRASAEMLKKHNLPEKFSGKLFSEIADLFVNEAEERPNDPISNNGLNAMLVRLADAQEEQKQLDEQAELEEEIANLSPEEQEQLMQMLAQQEAAGQEAQMQAVPQGVVPQEIVGEEQIPAQQMDMQQQMMARGGFIRRFDDGTPGTVAVNGDYNLGFSPDGYLPGAMYNKPSQPSLILDPATGNYYAAGFTPASQLSNQNPETVAVTDERKKKPVTLNSGSAVTITNPDTGETYQTVLPDGMQLADSQVTPVVKPDEVQLADSQATPITDFDAEPAPIYGGELAPARIVAFPGKTQAWVDAEVGPEGRRFKQQIADGKRRFAENAYSIFDEASLPLYFVPGVGEALMMKDAVVGAINGDYTPAATLGVIGAGKYVKAGEKVVKYKKKVEAAQKAHERHAAAKRYKATAQREFDTIKKELEKLGEKRAKMTNAADIKAINAQIAKLYKDYYEARRKVHNATGAVVSTSLNNAYRSSVGWLAQDPSKPMSKGRKAAYFVGSAAGLTGAGFGLDAIVDAVNDSKNGTTFHPYNPVDDAKFQIDSDSNDFAMGGFIRRFSGGSPGVVEPPTTPDDQSAAAEIGTNTQWLGTDDWKRGQLYGNYLPPDLKGQSERTDVPVPYSETGYYDSQQKAAVADDNTGSKAAGAAGAAGTAGAVGAATVAQTVSAAQAVPAAARYALPLRPEDRVQVRIPPIPKPASIQSKEETDARLSQLKQKANLNAAMRYAGVVTNGLMGLYNAFQKPDEYTLPTFVPTLPTGRLTLTNPVYNPVDENRFVNDVLANSAGTRRAVLNSGAGPSAAAVLLSQNYQTGNNIGAARLQAQEANLQRHNDVVARRNANAQAIGQFNSQLAERRADILNDARLQNMQNLLNLQKLNYGAEGEKMAAVSGSLNAMGKGLADIGTEEYWGNTLRSMKGLNYGHKNDGTLYHTGAAEKQSAATTNTKRHGGLLKRYKK